MDIQTRLIEEYVVTYSMIDMVFLEIGVRPLYDR